MLFKSFLSILALICSIPVFAQNPKLDTSSTNNLNEVVVTATRKSTDLLYTPYSVNKIDRNALDQFQYRTTPEALAGLTGLFIQKTNHAGGSPFLRGLTGNQTLLMVDGIRFNNSIFRYGPNQYLNTIDSYSISKIEVARGTGSVQFGSDALGGVIQVFTKDPAFSKDKSWHGKLLSKTFTQNMEYTGRAEAQYQSEKVAVLAGFTGRKFGDLVGGSNTGIQGPSGYQEQAADLKLKFELASNAVLTVAHQYLKQSDVDLYHRVKLENFSYYNFSPQQRNMSYGRLEFKGKSKWLNKISVIGSFQQSKEKRNYQKNANVNQFIEQDKVNTAGATADLLSLITKNWSANSGVEFYHDKVNSFKQQLNTTTNATFRHRGLYPNNATASNLSLYSLHHLNLKKWSVEAGLRWNQSSVNIPDTVTGSLRLGDVQTSFSSLVSNLAILYHVSKNQSVYTSFSTGYRTPNIDDMGTLGLVDFRYEIPSYELKPEKTYNMELGYRYVQNKVEASASIYYMHLEDLITRVAIAGQKVGDYNVYKKENSQKSFIRGAEASVNYQILKSFGIKTGVSYTYGQNLSRNEPMRRIPPLNGRVLAAYNHQNLQLAGEVLFAGKQSRLAQGDKDDNRIQAGGTPGWQEMNIYSGYRFKKFNVRTGIQNIFNTDYRTHGSGINGVGRSAWLGLQYNW